MKTIVKILVMLLLTACSNDNAKIEELIHNREKSKGNVATKINILNQKTDQDGAIHINYKATNSTGLTIQDSIKALKSGDGIWIELSARAIPY